MGGEAVLVVLIRGNGSSGPRIRNSKGKSRRGGTLSRSLTAGRLIKGNKL